MLNSKRYLPMNARDKMPFEVTPIFYKLQRYEALTRNCRRAARSSFFRSSRCNTRGWRPTTGQDNPPTAAPTTRATCRRERNPSGPGPAACNCWENL